MGAAAAPGSTPALPPRTSAYSEGAKRAMPSTGEPVHAVVWTNCPAFNGLAHEKIWLVPEADFDVVELLMCKRNGVGTKPLGVPCRHKKLTVDSVLTDVAVCAGFQKLHSRELTPDDLYALDHTDIPVLRAILSQSTDLWPFVQFAERLGVYLRAARVAGRGVLLLILPLVLYPACPAPGLATTHGSAPTISCSAIMEQMKVLSDKVESIQQFLVAPPPPRRAGAGPSSMPSGPPVDPIKLTIINIPPLLTDGLQENLAIRDMNDPHAVTLRRFVCKLLGRANLILHDSAVVGTTRLAEAPPYRVLVQFKSPEIMMKVMKDGPALFTYETAPLSLKGVLERMFEDYNNAVRAGSSAGRLLRAPGLVIEPYSSRKRQREGSQDSQPEFPPAPPAPPANSSCWDF